MNERDKSYLSERIKKEVFIASSLDHGAPGLPNSKKWLFNFKTLLMEPEFLYFLAEKFYGSFSDKKTLSVGGLETAGIPIVTGLTLLAEKYGKKVSPFYIRKTRKKYGEYQNFDGRVDYEDVVLVDDLINTGKAFKRQIEILEAKGKKVTAVWVILRYRNEEYYNYFHERGIEVHSLLELDDLNDLPNVRNLLPADDEVGGQLVGYEVLKKFQSANPNYHYIVQKSNPILSGNKIFFGTDNGTMWALDSSSAAVVWSFKTGRGAAGKRIFSTPVVYKGLVIFGSYDGAVYALSEEDGSVVWKFEKADWVGSSPTVSKKYNAVFVGLEYGLVRKRGAIVALSAADGRLLWEQSMSALTHASPKVLDAYNQVLIGSNDGKMRSYDTGSGALQWEYTTVGGGYQKINWGFGYGDIKESAAYSEKHNLIAFGSIDGFLYVLDRATGKEHFKFRAETAIYSTPVFHKDLVIFTCTDKHVYAVNVHTATLAWIVDFGGRIFASPVLIEGKLYVGANNGFLRRYDPDTGECDFEFGTIERITNNPVYDRKTKQLYVPTYANELFFLRLKELDREKT